jgi:hypothetical protein
MVIYLADKYRDLTSPKWECSGMSTAKSRMENYVISHKLTKIWVNNASQLYMEEINDILIFCDSWP